jgi:hypothetical protein
VQIGDKATQRDLLFEVDSDIRHKYWYFSCLDYCMFLSPLVNLTVPVNGSISLATQAEIGGDITSVNGDIELHAVTAEKNILSTQASIEIKGESVVAANE